MHVFAPFCACFAGYLRANSRFTLSLTSLPSLLHFFHSEPGLRPCGAFLLNNASSGPSLESGSGTHPLWARRALTLGQYWSQLIDLNGPVSTHPTAERANGSLYWCRVPHPSSARMGCPDPVLWSLIPVPCLSVPCSLLLSPTHFSRNQVRGEAAPVQARALGRSDSCSPALGVRPGYRLFPS